MIEARTTTETSPTRPTGDAVVQCTRLTKIFKDFWLRARVKAVNDVSFEIHRGEIFGLLGPNGSGKSTTIKIILGLLHKTGGRVSVFGRPPTDVAVKKRIGYLPEESYLYPFLNARETLDYYGKLFELDGAVRRKRIDELLDMVGLAGVQFRPVREYSKGMQRRIGIAQALINDPEFLILDEPTTGLDPIGTRQIKDLILELGRRGKTVLLSSHLLSDVEDCVDRMVILYGGKIQREGTCDQLLEATDRSIIEAETLDEGTIEEIDRVIRARSGGARSIRRVSRPRQKLEELFIDIVENARRAQVQTDGALHGGATASFLRAEGEQGDDLISSLVEAGNRPAVNTAAAASAAQTPTAGPDEDVLRSLVSGPAGKPGQPSAPAPMPSGTSGQPAPAKPPQPTPEIDQSLIGSLLDPGAKPAGDAKPGTPPSARRPGDSPRGGGA
jgi:ABC-2 type transport system ATP-binding protein